MRLFHILALLLMALPSFGQLGNRYIRNYTSLEYNAAKQNFYSTISQDQRIYFANEYGVLEYDGSNWELINIPSIPYAVRAGSDGRIYTGGVNELGYLTPDERGIMTYVSLDSMISEEFKPYDYIFDIYESSGRVYFSTANYIFIWERGHFEVIESKNSFHVLFKLDEDEFWVKEEGTGLLKIIENKTYFIEGTEEFKDKAVYAVIKTKPDHYLIFTRENGLYRYSKNSITPIETSLDEELKKSKIYHAIQLVDNTIAIATLRNGLIIIDENYNLKYRVNRSNGLQNEVVRQLNEDFEGNLWLCTDNGISKVDIISPLQKIDEDYGLEGIVNDLKIYNNQVFAATGLGLYRLDKASTDPRFERVEFFTVECGSIEIVDGQLIIGCNNGVFQYEQENSRKISNYQPWKILPSPNDPDLIYATHEHGVGLISRQQGNWEDAGTFKNVDYSITTISVDENNQIWLGTQDAGLIRLLAVGETHKEQILNEPIVEYFDEGDGLPSLTDNKVFWIDHEVFTTANGIYFYDEEQGFYQDSTFGLNFLRNPRQVKFISRDDSNNIWIFSHLGEKELTDRNEVSVAQYVGSGDFRWEPRFFEPYTLFDVNTILPDGDAIWFGGKGGVLYYRESKNIQLQRPDYKSVIRKVQINGDSLLMAGMINGLKLSEKLSYDFNDIKFSYAAPSYRNEDVNLYQIYLDGYDKEWSGWNSDTEKEYTNLAEGKYTFFVRSRNALNEVSETSSFSFEIKPPWFRTFWAYLVYAIFSVIIIFSFVYFYTYRLNKSKNLLERKVRERTKELQEANSSIIQQNIEIKNKNEKIEVQKEELKSNLVQIKDATETIEQRNFQLKEINTQLEKMVKDRTRKLNQVVKELQVSNNELDQFIYRSSHDLRGPVARLLGLVYLMRNDKSVDTEEYLAKLESSALELDVILNRLMKTRQIAKRKVKIGKIQISQLIDDLESYWKDQDDGVDRKLTSKINHEHELKTDHELLRILVGNLMDNSQKFRDGNKKDPYVNVDFSVHNSDRLRVTIEDNGIGIAKHIEENIYEMFFVGSNISTGLGLGLYEARVIAQKLNGELNLVESNNDRTIFEVSLPLN